jgi:hypothetical protein
MDTEEGWRISGQLLIMKKAIRRTIPASFYHFDQKYVPFLQQQDS